MKRLLYYYKGYDINDLYFKGKLSHHTALEKIGERQFNFQLVIASVTLLIVFYLVH